MTATIIKMSIQRMICTGCGAEANASCNCGKTYVPAAQRAKQYADENPAASVREIAEATGVGRGTAHRAKAGVPDGTPEPCDVIGRDGKSYPAHSPPKRPRPAVADENSERAIFLFGIESAVELATDAALQLSHSGCLKFTRSVIDELSSRIDDILSAWHDVKRKMEAMQ